MYSSAVKEGNWFEERCREEDAMKDYLEKKERGDLRVQKEAFLKNNILIPVTLSATTDGYVHFGDVVMLLNTGGEDRGWSTISINADIGRLTKSPSPGILSPCEVSAAREIQPCARNAFIITSVDGSPDGSILLFDQSFALRTTSGFVSGLYLTSDLRSPDKCAKKSRLQEVILVDSLTNLARWKVLYYPPDERLEYEGEPVPAGMKVVIKHCKTNQALAVLGRHVLKTTYGIEYEVTAHTFLDSHKAEEDKNHWVFCTSDLTVNEQSAPEDEESAQGQAE